MMSSPIEETERRLRIYYERELERIREYNRNVTIIMEDKVLQIIKIQDGYNGLIYWVK